MLDLQLFNNLSSAVKYFIPVFIFLLIFAGLLILRKHLLKYINKIPIKGAYWKQMLRDSLKSPSLLWTVIAALYFSLLLSPQYKIYIKSIQHLIVILLLISITLVLSNIAIVFLKYISSKKHTIVPITSLTQNITRITIITIGCLLILNYLGISITPMLTALGVGGLAVALALQDTLSNLFSGVYITLSQQVRKGDYIKLGSGEEGYVTDMDWRTTKIRMLPNNIILIPNNKLAQSIVTNFNMPQKEMAVLVQVGVHYDSDLEKVEKITCETAKETLTESPGGIPEFEPFIRYHTFDDFSINFTVILRCSEFVDKYLIKHEFIKKLHKRFNKEKIIIPYPIRAINNTQEK